jgi:sialate O-acetylesterase
LTFWNGMELGSANESDTPLVYVIPGSTVHVGRSVVAIRVVGNYTGDGSIGLLGPANSMKVSTCSQDLPLSGTWSYQTGPDLQGFPQVDPAAYQHLPSTPPPSTLFNGMIRPLQAFRIRGAIWYQGEANALEKRSVEYRTLFPALINDWRKGWGYEFPFFFVQLAGLNLSSEPQDDPQSQELSEAWVEMRESQSMALSLPLTGMATAIDIGEPGNIHPRNKQEVGRRLALLAEQVAYGGDVVSSGPVYRSMRLESGGVIRIEYANIGSGILIKDDYNYVRGFEVAGADGRFVKARARLDGNDILVYHDSLSHPLAVRYDWSAYPDGNVFNREGLPAVPFRTNGPTR